MTEPKICSSTIDICTCTTEAYRMMESTLAVCPCFNEGYLLGIGNPLLDISANVGIEVLDKYGLKPDDAIMAEEKHMPLYKELMEKYKADFIAGGSVQNTLRVAQWVLKKPKVCTYFGCVGNDKYAEILKERAEADGVKVMYQVNKEVPTGTCAVLIMGHTRSLCANLAAAQKFTPDHLDKPECDKCVKDARLFYSSGFFIAVSQESLMRLAKHAHENNLPFVLNLSAPFVLHLFKDRVNEIMPYCDVVLGNETECAAFAQVHDWSEKEYEQIALKIAGLPKLNSSRTRVVCITQGCDPVILVENGKVRLTPVHQIPSDEIVDTNGAGDAFAAGFLAQMMLGNTYKMAVKCGIYCATVIIQNMGCTFSGYCDFKS